MRATFLLHDYLIDSAQRDPDKVALVCKGLRVTYRELDLRSDALADALAARGVERGDRVVVFADNTVETVVAFWAVLKANAVVSVVNPLTKADKLAYLLNDCRSSALVTDGHLMAVFADAARRAPHLRTTIVSGGLDRARLEGVPGVVAWEDALGAKTRPPPRRNC